MARATISSLNAQRSSIDPPPRPTMTTSTPGTRPIARSAARDLERRALALHARGADDEVRVRVAPAEHLDDVADRGAVERRDDADLARQGGQRPFARRVEQPFVLQALLQLIEGELQRAEPVRLQVLADELILALGLVDRHASARDDAQAVGRLELQIAQRGSENDRPDLRGAVLQREIQMSRVPHAAVRELAFDPDLEELGFEQIAHANRQLGDGNTRIRRRVGRRGRRRQPTGVGGPFDVGGFGCRTRLLTRTGDVD